MKRYIPVIVVIVLLLADTANACTVDIVGQRKVYRTSSRVFVGEFLSVNGIPSPDTLPLNSTRDWKVLEKAKFRIVRSWKGHRSGVTELYFIPICVCPNRQILPKPGDRLLVFADKHGVVDACNMYVIEMKNDRREDDLKRIIDRLDSFWFRTWATRYPF